MVEKTKFAALSHSENMREQILNAAMMCMIQFGPKRANISSIASIAGVSRPTVYAHFENIEELLRESISRGTTLLCQRLLTNARSHASPQDRLINAFKEMLELADQIDVLRTPVDYAVGIGRGRADDGSIMTEAVDVAMAVIGELLGDDLPKGREPEEIAETVIRFFLSMAALKRAPDKQADVEGYIRRTVLPAIGYPPEG